MPSRTVAQAIEALGLTGSRLCVAVSGGLDSVCAVHLLMGLRERFGLELSVAHVDHGLRGEASTQDARFVEDLAGRLGLPFALRRVAPGALREGQSSRQRPTLQEAARQLRYAALREMADELAADGIATAHTADDQAETVLLRLLRGSSPDGLGGIPERSPDGRVVRPLLGVRRRELEELVRREALVFREDESNARDDYARNRLRHHWLPQLARNFNPQLLRALGNLAEAQRRDAEWIDVLVAEELRRRVCVTEGQSVIEREGWSELPDALARRVVKRLIERAGAGRHLSRRHVDRTLEFLRRGQITTPGGVLELPAGLRLSITRDSFVLSRVSSPGAAGC